MLAKSHFEKDTQDAPIGHPDQIGTFFFIKKGI